MASGFEGWISVFEDEVFDGASFANPQALYADEESLSFKKEIHFEEGRIRNNHVQHGSSLIYKAAKPQGEISFQLRSDDCLKVLLAHFQNGTTQATTSPYRYAFYPRTNPLDYDYRGTLPNQAYGFATARPYTISVLKKTFDTSGYGGTNSFFFKHGIVDKLGFSFNVGEDAKFSPHFFFRDLDYGTPVTANPTDGTVGTYSGNPSYQSWSGTVTFNASSIDLSSFRFSSNHVTQEYSRVGRQAPENYQLSAYDLTGEIGFDLPADALKHVGSSFTGGTFSLVATLFNSSSDRMVIEMPSCIRLPVDYKNPGGNKTWQGKVPFRAFENAGTYPIKITIDTTYGFGVTDLFGDAAFAARTLGNFAFYDAAFAARTLSSYTYYSHS